jgi:alpha-tubulin suppressor-like RCC1 family protein
MPASNQGIIDNINCKLTTGGLTDQQAAQLAGAAQALCCSTTLIVPSCACLPTASFNKGRFVYVQDLSDYRYSDGLTWSNDYCSVVSNNLYTWGLNTCGRLGDNTVTDRSSPGTVAGQGITWCMVSAGSSHTAAIKSDGTLWTWGTNSKGQLGTDNTTNRCSPGTVAGGGTNWCFVSAGVDWTAAIKTDGTLWTWGYNFRFQLGNGSGSLACLSQVSPAQISGGGTTWRFVAAGEFSGAAIKTDGSMCTWGYNGGGITDGVLGDGTTTNRSTPTTVSGGGTTWSTVSMGRAHTVATKTDGTLWTWGFNINGELGTGTTTSRSSPGTTAGGGTNWSCGVAAPLQSRMSAALKTDGTLWTWGGNSNGRLGNGTITNRSSPGTTAGGGTNWCRISSTAGYGFAAIKTDGTLWTWGGNSNGGLGDGTTTSRSSPGTVIGGLSNWISVSMANCHTIALQRGKGF